MPQPNPLTSPGAGIANNKPMSDPDIPSSDITPGDTQDSRADEKVSPDSSEDILSFLKDLHQKAVDAISGHIQKASVNGSASSGQQLYNVDTILTTLESIQNPVERAAFYTSNKKLVGLALQVKANTK